MVYICIIINNTFLLRFLTDLFFLYGLLIEK